MVVKSSLYLVVQIFLNFRRWVQAVFRISDGINLSTKTEDSNKVKENMLKDAVDNVEVDMSDGFAAEMFGSSASDENEVRFDICFNLLNFLKLDCIYCFVIVLAFIQL